MKFNVVAGAASIVNVYVASFVVVAALTIVASNIALLLLLLSLQLSTLWSVNNVVAFLRLSSIKGSEYVVAFSAAAAIPTLATL